MIKQDFINLGIDDELAAKCEELSLIELSSFVPLNQFEQLQSDTQAELFQLKVNSAVELALREANAFNSKTVLPLLSLDDVSFDEDGAISGLDGQISALASNEDTSFLFKSSASQFVGVSVGESGDEIADKPYSYSSVARLFEQNPNLSL